ncbi:MAG: hypothetical protein R3E13_11080 [Alphaproteobacteria bacterium]
MPDIFSKNYKLRLIEYGSNQQGLESFTEARDKIARFFQSLIRK